MKNYQELQEEIKKWFEVNYLDGDKVEEGSSMLSADFALEAILASNKKVVEWAENNLIEKIEVVINAQMKGIKQEAEFWGLDKWLGGSGILKTKYQQDKLEGQQDLLRWIKKSYISVSSNKIKI